MLLQKRVIASLRKLIYGLLIFCIGGIGSLTYFDGFLPGHEHGQHPYHWTIFEEPSHTHTHSPSPPKKLAPPASFWLFARQNHQHDLLHLAQTLAPGFARFFASGLSDGYILTTAGLTLLDLPRLFTARPPAALFEQSAWLAPPDRPPADHPG
jgi:hypothetical protein